MSSKQSGRGEVSTTEEEPPLAQLESSLQTKTREQLAHHNQRKLKLPQLRS